MASPRRWARRSASRQDRAAIDGDGCFQMTNQELVTCAINDIPIKVAPHQQLVAGHGAPAVAVPRVALPNTDLHSHRIPDFVKFRPTPTAATAGAARPPTQVDATIEKAMSS